MSILSLRYIGLVIVAVTVGGTAGDLLHAIITGDGSDVIPRLVTSGSIVGVVVLVALLRRVARPRRVG